MCVPAPRRCLPRAAGRAQRCAAEGPDCSSVVSTSSVLHARSDQPHPDRLQVFKGVTYWNEFTLGRYSHPGRRGPTPPRVPASEAQSPQGSCLSVPCVPRTATTGARMSSAWRGYAGPAQPPGPGTLPATAAPGRKWGVPCCARPSAQRGGCMRRLWGQGGLPRARWCTAACHTQPQPQVTHPPACAQAPLRPTAPGHQRLAPPH